MTIKWTIFYCYLLVESGKNILSDFSKLKTGEDIVYTIWMLAALPVFEMLILIIPFLMALRYKGWIGYMILTFTFLVEFLIGWYATNQKFATWMTIKIFISMLIYVVVFTMRQKNSDREKILLDEDSNEK